LVLIGFLPSISSLLAVVAVEPVLAVGIQVEAVEVPEVIGPMCLDKPLDVTPLLKLN
jgi:riboflavin transporter FmnP